MRRSPVRVFLLAAALLTEHFHLVPELPASGSVDALRLSAADPEPRWPAVIIPGVLVVVYFLRRRRTT